MGLTLSIACHAEEGKVSKAYVALLNRILAQGSIKKVELHENYPRGSDGYLPEIIPSDSLTSTISDLAESLVMSRNALIIEILYNLPSGKAIPLSVDFYGRSFDTLEFDGVNYGVGTRVRDESHILITLSFNLLARELRDLYRDMNATGMEVSESVLLQTENKTVEDAINIFFTACGLSEESHVETYIDHAAMFHEYGWPSPVCCQMIYHKNLQEFSRDFERIYAGFNWGILTSHLLEPDIDIWQFSSTGIEGVKLSSGSDPGRNYLESYRYFSKPQGFSPDFKEDDIVKFLESLDEETTKKLSKLSVKFMKEALQDAEDYLPEILYWDKGSRGAALTTGTLLSLWRAYQHVAQLAL